MKIFLIKLSRRILRPPLVVLWALGNAVNSHRNVRPIVISGSPRGGTTWVAESVARAFNSRRVIWEPLNPQNVSIKNLGFDQRPFVDKDSVSGGQYRFLKRLAFGKLINVYMFRLGTAVRKRELGKLLSNERLVIKFVRGNGVVGFLFRKFSIAKPLVIIRHPCAVVASQLKVGFPDHPQVSQKVLERYPSIKDVLQDDAPLTERQAMTWAADVLAARMNRDDLHIVYYEDIVMDPKAALYDVFASWGVNPDADSNFESIFGLPSSTSKEWTDLTSTQAKLSRWQSQLNATTISRILAVASDMGVDDYDDNLLPIHSENRHKEISTTQ